MNKGSKTNACGQAGAATSSLSSEPEGAPSASSVRLVWSSGAEPSASKVQFWASKGTVEAWDALRRRANLDSEAELIRRSVQLYGLIVDALDNGAEVVLRQDDGTVRRLDPQSL